LQRPLCHPPKTATEHNGIALPDVCLKPAGPNGTHHVFIIGDWGGVFGKKGLQPADARGKLFGTKHRQFVLGADDWAQQRVADQMAKKALVSNPDYIINCGDNFYWGGVGTTHDDSEYGFGQGFKCGASPPNVAAPSKQWQLIFEDVYQGYGIDGKPWLGVLGNHDYGGWKFTAAWDQAIGYTWTSNRWMTPAQYWRVTVRYPDFSVDWFFFDTNFADAIQPGSHDAHNICSRKHNHDGASCAPTGPSSVDSCFDWFAKLRGDELEWLESGLEKSTSQWQILVTHFPTQYYLDDATRIANLYGVDLFISGHAHMQTVVGENEDDYIGGCPYVISGGGGGITSEGLPDAQGNDDMYGFMDMTLSREEILIEAISHGGMLRNTKRIHPRVPTTTTTTTTGTTTTRTSSTSTATTTTTTSSTITITTETSTSSTSTVTTSTITTTTRSTSTTTTTTATTTSTTATTTTATDTTSSTTTTTVTKTTRTSTTETTSTTTSTYSVNDLRSWAHSGGPWSGFGRFPSSEGGSDVGDGARLAFK